MHVTLTAQPVYKLATNIIQFILETQKQRNNVYLAKIKAQYSRSELKIMGIVFRNEFIVVDDDLAIEFAEYKMRDFYKGFWKSDWNGVYLARAIELRGAADAAMTNLGDGTVTLSNSDIRMVQWYDEDWVTQYLK